MLNPTLPAINPAGKTRSLKNVSLSESSLETSVWARPHWQDVW